MSDHDKSGAPNPASADLPASAPAPAESTSAAATPSAVPVTFGSNRGSGLARGKRPAPPTAPAASAPSGGYKPTSLAVITPASEYKNPFTGETAVSSAPPVNEPAPQAAPPPPAPAPISRSPVPESSASIDATERSAEAPVRAAESRQPEVPENAAKPMFPYEEPGKAELKILPPEPAKRPAVSWEAAAGNEPAAATPAAPRRDDRPTFRTERDRDRRENPPLEPREPQDPKALEPREPKPYERREGREPRRNDRKFEPRTNQPYSARPRQPEAPKKSGGFFGWLKGLFGGGSSAAPAAGDRPAPEGRREDGDRGHQRHRGDRGRGQGGGYRDDNRGPRPEGQGGGDPRQQGEGDQGGQRRRRRRGGRGRGPSGGAGGGGGYRDDNRGPRPEGQQGGGAI